jgi:hypothetical protein
MDNIKEFSDWACFDLRDAFLLIKEHIGHRFGSVSLTMDSNGDFGIEVFVNGTVDRENEIYGLRGEDPKSALMLFMREIEDEEEIIWTPWWREVE